VSSEAREATRGSAIKLGAELSGKLIALATSLLIARGLGPAEFGDYAFLSVVAVLLAELGDAGLQATAQRALVAGTLSLSAMLRAKGLLLGLACAVFALGALLLPRASLSGLRPGLLLPLLLFYLLAGWSEFLGVALRARGMRGGEAATILCFRAVTLALVGLVLLRGLRLEGLVWALAASPVAAIALGAAWLSRSAAEPPQQAPAALSSLGVLRLALPLAVNSALALLSLRVEILLLPLFADQRATGLFAAALAVVTPMTLVPAAIAAGAMPALTREALRGSGPVRERTAATVALLGVPGAVGLALLAPAIVGLAFGADYAEAANALRLLAPALIAMFLNNVLLHSLVALGRAPVLPRLTALRVAAAAGFALLLIPAFGITGAAAGFTLSELLLLPLAARACARERFAVPVLRSLALAASLSLPMALVVAFARGRAVPALLAGGLTYGATVFAAWRLQPQLFSAAPVLESQGA
jgi:O-antigen/teichoic acid export membrane protein